jgi:hypothetical protein
MPPVLSSVSITGTEAISTSWGALASCPAIRSGETMVNSTLWPLDFSNSAAMTFVAICTEPTLSTRMSAADKIPDDSISARTAIIAVRILRMPFPLVWRFA